MISSELSRKIAQTVETNFHAQVKFLTKLVKTPSTNPFTPDNSSASEPVEYEVAELIFHKLHQLRLNPRRVGVTKKRSNIVCHFGPRRFRKSLLFNGQMDTAVPDKKGKSNPFAGAIRQNKLFGIGACDMKGALSSYIYAVKALKDLGVDLAGRMTLVFVVDTEPGACSELGTAYLLSRGIRARAALIGKPCTHTVAIGHRGGYRFKLTTYGDEVHTGLSLWEKKKMGRNAIVDMAEVIRAFRRMEIPFKSARLFPGRRPVFTFPTKIHGGRSVNLVPASCEAYGDVRLMPGNSSNQVTLLMEERLAKVKGLDYKIEDLLFVPAVEIDPKEEVVQILVSNAEQVLKNRPEIRGVGPWNDGWMYITRDIPTVCGFGPNGGDVGTNKEWVSLESVKKVTEIYARLIVEYLGLKGK